MNNLKVTRKVLPGNPGTKKELRQYRNRLVAVRYLTDGQGRYVKTAEVIMYDRDE